MFKRSRIVATVIGLALAAGGSFSCKDKKETAPPEEKTTDDGGDGGKKGVSEDNEDSFVANSGSTEEGTGETPTEDMDAATAQEAEKVKRPEPKEVCKTVGKGKAKKKECKLVDPEPKLSASLGVKALTKGFSWGMSPEEVLGVLSKGVEAEYAKRQKESTDPNAQDRNRAWRKEQLDELRKGNVKFTSNSKHKWGVSLIQYDFADDNGEEMVWIRSGTLRKFYFFSGGGLWKIVYAYNKEKWNKEYEDVVKETFYKWFGISPETKVKQDPKTAAPLVRYYEWTAQEGEKIRSFDLTSVHGIIMLTVIAGSADSSMADRLPNVREEEGFSSDVGDVLGGSDVEYDADGKIITK
ncbi:MAG: hypothetical protein R3B09_19570 [Nannocystaceae bacterium]